MSSVDDVQLLVEVTDRLESVTADQWNSLDLQGNPFVRYEFLSALETTGCLGEANGWYPRYFLLKQDEQLLAACACYIKTNSYGEFVFDWAWADAYERNGLPYYPKMICSIPYTPATGPRLLVHPEQSFEEAAVLLQQTVNEYCSDQKMSGMHWLFVTERESELLAQAGHMSRIDCQYHWQNQEYSDFEHFLAGCTSKRRKTIRRERRYVTDAHLRLERRLGSTLSRDEWALVHQFYTSTFESKWGNPSLTKAFFEKIGETMGDNCLIVFAYNKKPQPIAASIMFFGESTLYGRFWGCEEEHHCLHFEACYYQGIEYCIERGFQRFEPGAQGEHKITRGFEPTITRSAHRLEHDGFRTAVEKFLAEETKYMLERCAGLTNLLPFKQEIDVSRPEEARAPGVNNEDPSGTT